MKRVLITGASSGIGLQLAKTCLRREDQVIACGRDQKKLELALSDIANPSLLTLCVCDISHLEPTLKEMGQHKNLDLVILNAGNCEYIDQPLAFDSKLFARVIQTNVIGTGHCLQATLPNLHSGGQLAIVSSAVTLLPLTRAEAYGASKAALDYLTRTLSIDLASKNIFVSLIRPGFVDTPLTKKNNFSMPGIITPEQACHHILTGLKKRKRIINFPKYFYWKLKFLSMLPDQIWRFLAIKMVK
ncbi:MAG: SDR family NAD(P)-dependent oxidoreductase [Gammaproteobacteria bacterium]|nr:SDR family NAD(P)-dependent oxidoreductase [Gammaproteobacteria bacterium]